MRNYRAPFTPQDTDPVVATHERGNRLVEIRCTSNGTFYAHFANPLTEFKNRTLSRLRKEIEAELIKREGQVSIPFLLMNNADEIAVRLEPKVVHGFDQYGTGLFRRYPKAGDSSLNTRYNNERFLRVLSFEEFQHLLHLAEVRAEAQKAWEKALDEFTFDPKAARQLQQERKYPTEHAKDYDEWDGPGGRRVDDGDDEIIPEDIVE